MAIYYVDPSKSDSNDGLSPATAWQSLTHACATIAAAGGDTVHLLGGVTHIGSIVLNGLGNTFRITFDVYGGGKATIPCSSGTQGALLTNMSYVTLRDLIVVGTGVTVTGTFPNVVASGPVPGDYTGIGVNTTTLSTQYTGIEIYNCEVHQHYRGISFYAVGTSATVAHRNCLIQGCLVDQCLYAGYFVAGDGPATAGTRVYDTLTFQNCVATNIYGDTAQTAGGTGIGFLCMGCTNSVFDHCYASGCGLASAPTAPGGPGCYEWAYSDNCVCRDCEGAFAYCPEGQDGCAFDADLGAVNTIFERCYAHDCHGEAFLVYGGIGTIIRACVMTRCALYRVNRGGALHVDAGAGSGACTFIHNTVFHDYVGTPKTLNIPVDGCVIVNNIFSVGAGAYWGVVPSNISIFGNNYLVRSGSTWKWNLGGVDYTSLAILRSSTGDEHVGGVNYGLDGDPLLLAPANPGPAYPSPVGALTAFDLGPGSPVLNTEANAVTAFGIPAATVGTKDFHNAPLQSSTGTGFSFGATQQGSSAGGAAGRLVRGNPALVLGP